DPRRGGDVDGKRPRGAEGIRIAGAGLGASGRRQQAGGKRDGEQAIHERLEMPPLERNGTAAASVTATGSLPVKYLPLCEARRTSARVWIAGARHARAKGRERRRGGAAA